MSTEQDNQAQSGDEWVGLLSMDGYWRWDGRQWQAVDQEETPSTPAPKAARPNVPEWKSPWATPTDNQSEKPAPADPTPMITRAALFGKKSFTPQPPAESQRPIISPSVSPPTWKSPLQPPAPEQELIPWSRPQSAAPLPTPIGREDALIPQSTAAITTDRMLQTPVPVPESGFRRLIFDLTAGHLNLGPSVEDKRRRQLLFLIRTRVNGCRRIAVISRKGGIGKTTTSLMLGHQFASARGDRVVALDANPDAGSLGDRVVRETEATVTDILREGEHLSAYSDVRRFTSQAPSRLEVVASDNDPSITEALGAQDYSSVMDVLARHYSLILCDTGTGILDSATRGILDMADQVVLCAAPSLDASRVSASTLDWLEKHGYGQLAQEAVVAINGVRPGGPVEVDKLQKFFERRCRAVTRIPWDVRLAAGAETTLEELHPATRAAYFQLAAMVAAGFVRTGGPL
ncbi:MAG: AAA family ATPase [Candidatus Dormibacteraceae bacterium]